MPGRPRWTAAGLAALVLVTGCGHTHRQPAVITSTTTTAPAPDAPAMAWDAQATTAFQPLTTALPNLDGIVSRWQAGHASDGELRTGATAAIAQVVEARTQVEGLPPFPDDAMVNDLYRSSVIIDLQAANADAAVADLPAGSDLRAEVVLLGTRLRRLGDRVFDRGRAIVQPHLAPVDPNVVLNLPEEVPNWTVEGMAAGPPLDPAAPAIRPLPNSAGELRMPDRPTQSRAAWLAAVNAASIPSSSAVAAAIVQDPDPALARAFITAAEVLRATPDPVGDREGATRLRLGLLLDADAIYAGRAAVVSPPGQPAVSRLRDLGLRLSLVADRLWPADLGPRASGLDPSLLTDDR